MQPLPDGIHHSPFSHNTTMRIRSPTTTSTSSAIQNTAVGFSFVTDKDPRGQNVSHCNLLPCYVIAQQRLHSLQIWSINRCYSDREGIASTRQSILADKGLEHPVFRSLCPCVSVLLLQPIILYCSNAHQLICHMMKPYVYQKSKMVITYNYVSLYDIDHCIRVAGVQGS